MPESLTENELIERKESTNELIEITNGSTSESTDSVEEEEYDEEEEEEDEVLEVNDVSILATSKLSLAQKQIPAIIIEKNILLNEEATTYVAKLKRLMPKLPLKGYIFAIMCALCVSIMTTLLKLSSTLTGI